MKVAIVGCRDYNNYTYFKEKIEEWINEHGPIDSIVSGGATGVDTLAEKYADENNIKKIIYPVSEEEWHRLGFAAGPIRNTKIINELLTSPNHCHVIALPSKKSKGTYDTIRKANNKKIPVTIFHV